LSPTALASDSLLAYSTQAAAAYVSTLRSARPAGPVGAVGFSGVGRADVPSHATASQLPAAVAAAAAASARTVLSRVAHCNQFDPPAAARCKRESFVCGTDEASVVTCMANLQYTQGLGVGLGRMLRPLHSCSTCVWRTSMTGTGR